MSQCQAKYTDSVSDYVTSIVNNNCLHSLPKERKEEAKFFHFERQLKAQHSHRLNQRRPEVSSHSEAP